MQPARGTAAGPDLAEVDVGKRELFAAAHQASPKQGIAASPVSSHMVAGDGNQPQRLATLSE
jgi:hypothetical protein